MNEYTLSPFNLAYKTIDGVSAIWFEYKNTNWIVDPCKLFNGMFDSDNTELLYHEYTSKANATYYVEQDYDGTYFYWTIKPLLGNPECRLRFVYKDFLSKTEAAFNKLYVVVTHNKPTVYDGIITSDEIVKIYNQFHISKLFCLPGSLRSSEIKEEELLFWCPYFKDEIPEWKFDIPYLLRIGNRKITSYISDWSNNIDYIRYQLESYCYCRKAQIKLYFEDEPTVIKLEQVSTLASVNKSGSGHGYTYDKFMKVDICPNSFVNGASIRAFCDEKKTIKELYEGLLNVGRLGYAFAENDYGSNAWNYDAIVFYNHIKSPIIERYIGGIEEEYNQIVERQKIIHYILTISPYSASLLGKMTGQSGLVEVGQDDIVTLYKDDSINQLCSVTLTGVHEWLDQFERYRQNFRKETQEIDYNDWYLRGMILAKELKKKLPDDVDVWYGNPMEDEESCNSRPELIMDGTLKEYFENELAKACLKNDKDRIAYCLDMDADVNANDGSALKNLIASEKSIKSIKKSELLKINKKKFEIFEYLCAKGLIVNHGKKGITPVLELCKIWKCYLIENRIHEILSESGVY